MNVAAAYGPEDSLSTMRASVTVRSATRREWPLVVGSRDSMASTLAVTKPSKSFRMSS